MKNSNMNRRTFLKVTTVAGSGLLVGCTFDSPKLISSAQVKETELGLWVRISRDNKITSVSYTHLTLPTILLV